MDLDICENMWSFIVPQECNKPEFRLTLSFSAIYAALHYIICSKTIITQTRCLFKRDHQDCRQIQSIFEATVVSINNCI